MLCFSVLGSDLLGWEDKGMSGNNLLKGHIDWQDCLANCQPFFPTNLCVHPSVGVFANGLRPKKGASQTPQRNRSYVGVCWWSILTLFLPSYLNFMGRFCIHPQSYICEPRNITCWWGLSGGARAALDIRGVRKCIFIEIKIKCLFVPHHCARFFPSTVCHVNTCFALTAQDARRYIWRVTTSSTILWPFPCLHRSGNMAACRKQEWTGEVKKCFFWRMSYSYSILQETFRIWIRVENFV